MLNLSVLVFCCQLWLNKDSLKDCLFIQSTLFSLSLLSHYWLLGLFCRTVVALYLCRCGERYHVQTYSLTPSGNDWLQLAHSSYGPSYIWSAKLWMGWLERALWTGQSLLVFRGSSKLVTSLLYKRFFSTNFIKHRSDAADNCELYVGFLAQVYLKCGAKTVVDHFCFRLTLWRRIFAYWTTSTHWYSASPWS